MIARTRRRPGFTLIELMIVIGIMVVLATLGFLFLPNLDRNKGVPNAVAQLTGWINLSKAQALRDHRPHGIRFIQDPNNPTRCTAIQYIEQPDAVAPRGPGITLELTTPNPNPNPNPLNQWSTATLKVGPPGNANPINWDGGVDAGDFLELTGGPNGLFQIRAVLPSGGAPRSVLLLDDMVVGTEPPPSPPGPPNQQRYINMTTGFRVIRAPRPLAGEAPVQLHRDVYIDLMNCYPCPLNLGPPVNPSGAPYGNAATQYIAGGWGPTNNGLLDPSQSPPNPPNNIDLMFNSSGFVASAPTGMLILTVRHVDRPNDALLVCVYTRTGKVTTHVVNDVGLDPYSEVRKGTNPGL
jgi:prepilin-type N-terminal cleavage/methylation domain-containing protein